MYWLYISNLSDLSEKNDKYWFINENEIRIAAGMTLVFALSSLFFVLLKARYDIALFLVSILILDFLLKIFISPQWSIFWSIARIFTKKWKEIWVGAIQKRFAWSIGLFLSSFVLYCILLLGRYISPVAWEQSTAVNSIIESTVKNLELWLLVVTPMNPTIFVCVLCIVFMWLESAAGYCVGCHIYRFLVGKWWMKEYRWQNCADGVCEI